MTEIKFVKVIVNIQFQNICIAAKSKIFLAFYVKFINFVDTFCLVDFRACFCLFFRYFASY